MTSTSSKRCLITGANGFLGRYLCNSLSTYSVITLGRSRGDFICNLATSVPALPEVEYVVHAAGLAHVMSRNPDDEKKFEAQNVSATRNLLAGLQVNALPEAFVFISSVSVYGRDTGTDISEAELPTPSTAYGRSKLAVEKLLRDWAAAHNIKLLILRLPLIAGNQPPGNLGKMSTAIKSGKFRKIGSGDARKSMVLASDVANGIARWFGQSGVYNLTDGHHPSFAELETKICSHFGLTPKRSLPKSVMRFACRAGDCLGSRSPVNTDLFRKMTESLTFDDSRARRELNWSPNRVLDAEIEW